ncbi:MAG: hypothetical protein INR71_11920, partial [Terriglobus roseus]|nr:hypothetical protein [Terriglobus roseus]
ASRDGPIKPAAVAGDHVDAKTATPAPFESKTEITDFAASVTTTATQSTVDLDTSARGRDSFQLSDRGASRRPSVTFDAASLSAGSGTTPSASGSMKIAHTGPPTPADEGAPSSTGNTTAIGNSSNNKGWLAGMTLGPRRDSRGGGADKREPRDAFPRSGDGGKRASSTSAGDRLGIGITVARLAGKMSSSSSSRDKLPASTQATFVPGAEGSGQQPDGTAAGHSVHLTEPVGVVVPAPDAQPRRLSLNLLAPPRLGESASSSPASQSHHGDAEKPSAAALLGVGRSRSLRHRHRIGMVGGAEEKRRSKSRGRTGNLIAEERAVASSSSAGGGGGGADGVGQGEDGGLAGGEHHGLHPSAAAGGAKKGSHNKPDRECLVM